MPSQQVSLDRLREVILENQAKGKTNPTVPAERVVVKDGRINLASNLRPDEQREAIQIQQDVFHARLEEEQRAVVRFFPRDTALADVDGIKGWSYSVVCEFGQRYEMFAYFDGTYYQVAVLTPEIEKRFQSPHTGHIFSSGNICFGTSFNNGRPTIEEAYAKSILWANGFSSMLVAHDETFPFSLNNQ